ncbi:MAG: hypothetical protein IT233_12945 [Bacteroidia bacterium]|nr:hypothetical protein [Bacteroidia bacterium]
MNTGHRPDVSGEKPGYDATREGEEERRFWPLGVTILRGFFFLLAISFTCASLIYVHSGNEMNANIIFGACITGMLVITIAGWLRGTVFDAILMMLITLVMLSLIRFEYMDDIGLLRNPESVRDSVSVSSLPQDDSARSVRFLDARVVISDTLIVSEWVDDYRSYLVIAPVYDTWRDTLRGDSTYGFAVGYSFEEDHVSLISSWEDTCRSASILRDDYSRDQYLPLIENWTTRSGRGVVSNPVLLNFTCTPPLNNGEATWELLAVFFGLIIPWIVIISIVRGISALVRKN